MLRQISSLPNAYCIRRWIMTISCNVHLRPACLRTAFWNPAAYAAPPLIMTPGTELDGCLGDTPTALTTQPPDGAFGTAAVSQGGSRTGLGTISDPRQMTHQGTGRLPLLRELHPGDSLVMPYR